MISMTGFGEGEKHLPQISVGFRIRTINAKGLDMSLKLPMELTYLEPQIRRHLKSQFHRGRLDVSASLRLLDESLMPEAQIDLARVHALLKAGDWLVQHPSVHGSVDVNTLLRIGDLFQTQTIGFTLPKNIEAVIFDALNEAIDQTHQSRVREGRSLFEEMLPRCQALLQALEEIEKLVQERGTALQEHIRQRLCQIQEDVVVDQIRLAQEVLHFADRLDITEELTRFRSHQASLESLILSDQSPKGREMEFILQELSREITTVGNKIRHLEGSKWVVTLKTELEKIREQAMNIE
jgi:uncharacterized protein (TIGR00255 family)